MHVLNLLTAWSSCLIWGLVCISVLSYPEGENNLWRLIDESNFQLLIISILGFKLKVRCIFHFLTPINKSLFTNL